MTIPNEILTRFKDWKTFSVNDVFFSLGKKDRLSKKTLQVTLSRMCKQRKFYRISKGVFSVMKSAEVAGFAYTPFYYGGVSALMIRDLIDDQVLLEVMTVRTVRRSRIKAFGDTNMILHHLPKEYYFGFVDVIYANNKVPVSDPEKTMIDLLYFKIKISDYDYAGLIRIIDREKLESYLKRYKAGFTRKVIVFFDGMRKKSKRGELESGY